MIRNINSTISIGLNSLAPPVSLTSREISVTDVGVGLTIANQFVFIEVINDDDKDDLFVVVGSTIMSTDPNIATRLRPKETLELFRNQIPDNTKALAFQTIPTKVALARIFYGDE